MNHLFKRPQALNTKPISRPPLDPRGEDLEYWSRRCAADPTAPGCKLYDV